MSRRSTVHAVTRVPVDHPDLPGNFQEVTVDVRVVFPPGDEVTAARALGEAVADLARKLGGTT